MNNEVFSIGLLDYDLLLTRNFICPNYDLGITYSYLLETTTYHVRLISTLDADNLSHYDKIYVFWQDQSKPHPSTKIDHYYKLPIQEYGYGFQSKPLRPFLIESRDREPNFKCYNPMLQYSLFHPKANGAWKIAKSATVSHKWDYIRLFEKMGDEWLKKDTPRNKYVYCYDIPSDILLNKDQLEEYTKLLNQGYSINFVIPLDLSKLKTKKMVEDVFKNPKYNKLRDNMVITELNKGADYVIDYLSQKIKSFRRYRYHSKARNNYIEQQPRFYLEIRLKKEEEEDNIVKILLICMAMRLQSYKFKIYANYDGYFTNEIVADLYNYMKNKSPFGGSFYRYIALKGFSNIKHITITETTLSLISRCGFNSELAKLHAYYEQSPYGEELEYWGTWYEPCHRNFINDMRIKYEWYLRTEGFIV